MRYAKFVLRYHFQVVSQRVSTVPLQPLLPSTVPLQPLLPSEIVYHQILVNTNPKRDDLQVTFDDNKDDNCWSYHQGGNYPNVSGLSCIKSDCSDVMPHQQFSYSVYSLEE